MKGWKFEFDWMCGICWYFLRQLRLVMSIMFEMWSVEGVEMKLFNLSKWIQNERFVVCWVKLIQVIYYFGTK